MADEIAQAYERGLQARLVDGSAFELSVVVNPVCDRVFDLMEEALRMAAPGFDATISGGNYYPAHSDKQLVAMIVGDITLAYSGSNRTPSQFTAPYRVGILKDMP